jgi:hypothetical protein
MENLGLAVAQNWYPTLFFGLTAHHFASWILARLGQRTGLGLYVYGLLRDAL